MICLQILQSPSSSNSWTWWVSTPATPLTITHVRKRG
jgi:hypothetical protein